jgi:hypothetical protein
MGDESFFQNSLAYITYITQQALHTIEPSNYIPATAVILYLTGPPDHRVEDLLDLLTYRPKTGIPDHLSLEIRIPSSSYLWSNLMALVQATISQQAIQCGDSNLHPS